MQQEERLAKLKKQPTFWRTILVDPDTGLPAYQNDALANQLDSPLWKMHFYVSPRHHDRTSSAISAWPPTLLRRFAG
jgi:hypothetical protein